jgi:hypothetical protein
MSNPPWRSIRILGAAPVLGLSFTALIATPLLAKGIYFVRHWLTNLEEKLPQEYEPFAGWIHNVASTIHLPLVIRLLAISALLASVGKLIYLTRCPAYFRVGESFAEFKRAHPFALSVLEEEFINLWNSSAQIVRHKIVEDFLVTHGIALSFHLGGNWMNDIEPLTSQTIIRAGRRGDFAGPRSADGVMAKILMAPDIGEGVLDILLVRRDFCRRGGRLVCAWSFYGALIFFALAVMLQVRWVILEVFS